jgi:UDP-galactopyranose mutase
MAVRCTRSTICFLLCPANYSQESATNYHPNEHDYTRVTEFKHLTGQSHSKTSVVYEYPCDGGDPYYRVPRPENAALYKQYEALGAQMQRVYFAGRLATYKYGNMDQVVAQALTLCAKLSGATRGELVHKPFEAAVRPSQLVSAR